MTTSSASLAKRILAAVLSLLAFGLAATVLWTAISTGLPGRLVSLGALGALRTLMGEHAFWVIATLLLLLVGGTAGHLSVMGPRSFSHEGEPIEFFSVALRINHLFAALACSVMILTGGTMMAAAAPGTRELLAGTGLVTTIWSVHAVTAIVFACTLPIMLARWSLIMIPRRHDLGWVKIMGGYLSREKRPVPAHKFNFGQKMWFWLATLGGLVMGTTGLLMHLFVGGTDFLNLMALVHHVVATAIVSMFVIHHYMSLFAIKGSIRSMIDGHKNEEEVAIMHSLYFKELRQAEEASGGEARRGEALVEDQNQA